MNRVLGAGFAGLCIAALTVQAGQAQTSQAQTSQAQTSQAQPADRYGPSAAYAHAPAVGDDPGAPRSSASISILHPSRPLRMLSWPGKTVPAAAFREPARNALAAPTLSSRVAPPPHATRYAAFRPQATRLQAAVDSPASAPASAAPHYGLVRAAPRDVGTVQSAYPSMPAYQPIGYGAATVPPGPPSAGPPAGLAGAPVRASLPTSIYDAPRQPWTQRYGAAPAPVLAPVLAPIAGAPRALQTAAAPAAQPGGGGQGVRFYSLHRQYGLKPDPAPIPPQFFAATPDLNDAPGPIPNRRFISGAGTAAQAARTVQASEADPPASAQP